jgi:hypothetical protein
MTTLCLNTGALIAQSAQGDTTQHTVEVLPRYEMDAEERRWQLEWERRNVED